MTSSRGVRATGKLALGIAVMAGLAGTLLFRAAAAEPTTAEARAHEAWRTAIDATPVPAEGCFRASYPNATWTKVRCTVAPKRPYIPRSGVRGHTVGNGKDYAAVTAKIVQWALGSFPVVKGVKSETGYDGFANTYSLQLNSNFMTTAGCKGSADPANCLTWEQFVYSSSETAAFMQYWLIGYGATCPDGTWIPDGSGDCYKNSNAVYVPQIAVTSLQSLKIHGYATAGGIDTLTMTTATEAYSTTGKDSVVYLATAWTQSEFNVIGDGGGSQAKFNKGSSVTVEIALKDGSTAAPTCQSNDGTTGETNNLNLGSCVASGGSSPSIKFTETN